MNKLLPAAGVLGTGIVLGALVFGLFFYQTRAVRDTIRVTGAATQRFEGDIAKWQITLSRQATAGALQDGYAQLAEDLQQVRSRLSVHGINADSLVIQPVDAQPNYNRNGNVTGYTLRQSLYLVSRDVSGVEALALNPGELMAGGAVLEASNLQYFYSTLDSLKHNLLAQATEDARRRAEEIAEGSDLVVGKIISANAGVFQITEPYSTNVTSYGLHNTSTRRQEITVTVHATLAVD